jgi:hypothetical protein
VIHASVDDLLCFQGRNSHTQQNGALYGRSSIFVPEFQERINYHVSQLPESLVQLLIGKIGDMLSSFLKIVFSSHNNFSLNPISEAFR